MCLNAVAYIFVKLCIMIIGKGWLARRDTRKKILFVILNLKTRKKVRYVLINLIH